MEPVSPKVKREFINLSLKRQVFFDIVYWLKYVILCIGEEGCTEIAQFPVCEDGQNDFAEVRACI